VRPKNPVSEERFAIQFLIDFSGSVPKYFHISKINFEIVRKYLHEELENLVLLLGKSPPPQVFEKVFRKACPGTNTIREE
jgi:hypothetical protein